jgi:hypothetical protein
MLTVSQINDILDVSLKNDRYTKGIYTMIDEFFEDNEVFERVSIIITLIYLRRYKDSNCSINNKNIIDLLNTCLILSNKFICDFQILGSGPLENHVLDKIKWNLYVDKKEFDHVKEITQSNFNVKYILGY